MADVKNERMILMKKGIIWAIVAVIIIALVGVGVYFSNQDGRTGTGQ